MPLTSEELQPIIEELISQLEYANEQGTLFDFLSPHGLQGLLPGDSIEFDDGSGYGEVWVFGDCSADKNHLAGVFADCGFDRRRLRFFDYEEAAAVNIASLQYSSSVSAIMFGPCPHKGVGIGDSSSILVELKDSSKGYPPIVELKENGAGQKHRISKTSFKAGLMELMAEKAIRGDRV